MRWVRDIRELFYTSMRQVFPLSLVYVFLVLVQNLFLTPTSFFSVTAGLKFYKSKWLFAATEYMTIFSRLVLCLLVGLLLAHFIRLLLERQGHDFFVPSLIGFLLAFLLFGEVSLDIDSHIIYQPVWLLLLLGGLFFYGLACLNEKWRNRFYFTKWFLLSLLIYLILFWTVASNKVSFLNIHYYVQEGFSRLLGNGPVKLMPVLLLSFLGPILLSIGLIVPDALALPSFSLTSVSENLDAVLNHSIHKVSHLFTLYTVQGSFALYGGVGLLLALGIAIVLASKKQGQKDNYQIAILSLLPLLFDQSLPLLLAFPILFQPILLLPMLLSTLLAELIGALLLLLGFVNPAVYEVPTGTPNILFGFLASNGDWRHLIVTAIILTICVLVYLPFVNNILSRKVQNEEISENP